MPITMRFLAEKWANLSLPPPKMIPVFIQSIKQKKYFFKMKWLFLVVLHFNWFYTVTYFTCLLWIFDRGKLGKSLFSTHDRHTPSRIAIKKSSIRIKGNLKFKFCPYINKILLQFSPILHLNDLWSKHTSCLDDAVCLYSMAVLSKRDFELLLIIILDR